MFPSVFDFVCVFDFMRVCQCGYINVCRVVISTHGVFVSQHGIKSAYDSVEVCNTNPWAKCEDCCIMGLI